MKIYKITRQVNIKEITMIKSISYNQHEILEWIMSLYCPFGFDLDPTYSKGNFYKKGIPQPKYKSDIDPTASYVSKYDCRKLPFKAKSLRSIIYDPPFLATTGPSLNEKDNNNLIAKRFSVFPNMPSLWGFYKDSLVEFWRLLKTNGVLVVKIQDSVSSGKQYLSHHYITQKAIEIGYYPKDIFILLAKNRLVANWQKNQKHARKYHCYFLVFQKSKVKVNYEET